MVGVKILTKVRFVNVRVETENRNSASHLSGFCSKYAFSSLLSRNCSLLLLAESSKNSSLISAADCKEESLGDGNKPMRFSCPLLFSYRSELFHINSDAWEEVDDPAEQEKDSLGNCRDTALRKLSRFPARELSDGSNSSRDSAWILERLGSAMADDRLDTGNCASFRRALKSTESTGLEELLHDWESCSAGCGGTRDS